VGELVNSKSRSHEVTKSPIHQIANHPPRSIIMKEHAGSWLLDGRVCWQPPLERASTGDAVTERGVADVPGAVRWSPDRQLGFPVTVEIGGDWSIAWQAPVEHASTGDAVAERGEAGVPRAVRRPEDRQLEPSVTIKV